MKRAKAKPTPTKPVEGGQHEKASTTKRHVMVCRPAPSEYKDSICVCVYV